MKIAVNNAIIAIDDAQASFAAGKTPCPLVSKPSIRIDPPKENRTMAKTATKTAKPPTKSQIHGEIADKTGLAKKDVAAVFEELESMISKNLKPRGPQAFTVPGLMKIVVNKRPATKAREGRNPATGEPMMFAAKPARKVVKVRPLKNLKEMI
ncbi:MAG: HU family DNA-binding protein [Phycisphaeraceae bacterium]